MSLVGTNVNLRGSLGWKGERGYSAYEIAVQNGFIGDEQTWLATLGTSSHFREDSLTHTSTAGQTSFDIPSNYTSNSFIDVYVNGLRLNSNEYTINTSTKKISLVGITLEAGQTVEIVVLTMATNALPIVSTLSTSVTNDEAAGAKVVYDNLQTIKTSINTVKTDTNTAINTLKNNTNTAISELESETDTKLATKLNSSNIRVLTGSIAGIAAGSTKIADIAYPSGFTKDNTVIISKMSSSNNTYYDVADLDVTASGYPCISMVALTDSNIRVWLKNTNASEARIGYYKITIMKIG